MHTPTHSLISSVAALSLGICALPQEIHPAPSAHGIRSGSFIHRQPSAVDDPCSDHLYQPEEALAGNGWVLMQHVWLEMHHLYFYKHQGHFMKSPTEVTLKTKILPVQHEFAKALLTGAADPGAPSDAGGTGAAQ